MKIKDYYKQSFDILKKNKKIFLIVLILYLASLLGGIIYYNLTYEGFSSIEAKEDYQRVMAEINFRDNIIGNFINLFTHNIIASLFRIIGGILLGIIPVFSIIDGGVSNSYSLVASTIDDGLSKALLLFIPHSLFEIPAFILSSSLGLIIFLSLFKKGKRIDNLKDSVIESTKIFLLWILPLLLIAGMIESILIMYFSF